MPEPGEDYVQKVLDRLGTDNAEWIGYGLQRGLVVDRGNLFWVISKDERKLKWFSIHTPAPRCNWEAFVHVVSYLRLFGPSRERALRLDFEDNGMDLTVRNGTDLTWYVEIKEQRKAAEALLRSLTDHGRRGVDLTIVDKRVRGQKRDTSIPKAQYLVKYHPKYFSLVAMDYARHFSVSLVGNTFTLVETNPPFEASASPPASDAKATTA